MYKVNDEQVEFILSDIRARGIVLEDLQYNLLDHMCCIIEDEMPKDADFHKFYKDLLPRFFKKELSEIQEETDNLLTFKNYFAMKNTLKISGLTSTLLLFFGAIFKVLHLPGASILIVLGTAIFSLLFMPLMIVLKFKDEAKAVDKWVLSFGFVIGIVSMIGIVFKLLHWPYANILMISGIGSFVFMYVPLYFITRVRRAELRFNTIVNSVMMMALGGMLFALFNLHNSVNINESIFSSQEFLQTNTKASIESNQQHYASTELEADGKKYHELNNEMLNYIDELKISIVSKLEDTNKIDPQNFQLRELARPGDHCGVRDFFVNASGKYSLKDFVEHFDAYNGKVIAIHPQLKIDIQTLDLELTTTSLLLTDLTQIQHKIAVTELTYFRDRIVED
jgi:hypothetical protein